MASEWDVVVVGGANMDYLVRGRRLPAPGQTVDGEIFQQAPGGKGANQAVAAARLGARVAFVGRLGQDKSGDELIEALKAEGVDTRYIMRDSKAHTGVALIMVDHQGEKQILTAPGANRLLTISDLQEAAGAIASSRVVLTQFEVPLDVVTAAARIGREAGARIILDPAPPATPSQALLGLVDVIRPNADEAEMLTGMRVHDRKSARAAAKRLMERGVKAVAVQAGSDGNLLVWPDGEVWLLKLPVKSVDATGAGDAFAAALAVAIAEGRPWQEAGPFANAAAALATTVIGAQAGLPRREAVMELIARNKTA